MNKNLEMIKCSRCGESFPKMRLTLYGYNFCIKCSDVTPKVGRVIVIGEGDHTATELEIVDQETAGRLHELENLSRRGKSAPVELLNFEDEEVKIKGVPLPEGTVLEEDEDVEEEEEAEEDLLDIEEEEED